MHMSCGANLHELKTLIEKRRAETISIYNQLQLKLDSSINKGDPSILLNGEDPIRGSEIRAIIQKISDLKKQIFSMNSALLSLESAGYGVCVKSGKFIPQEWPNYLSDAGFEGVEQV